MINESNDLTPTPEGPCTHEGAEQCGDRRQFLVRATMTAGGALLGLAGLATGALADDHQMPKALPAHGTTSNEVVLSLNSPALAQVGGFETVQTKVGRVVVARTGEATFAACSAVCPHKGGPILYDASSKSFYCPWHHSKFNLHGKVEHGPAKTNLTPYAAGASVTLELKC